MAMIPGATFRTIDEGTPGPKLAGVFSARAEAYAAWYLQDGDELRPSAAEGVDALGTHMPELVPAYEAMVAEVGHRSSGRAHVHDVEATRGGDRLFPGGAR